MEQIYSLSTYYHRNFIP